MVISGNQEHVSVEEIELDRSNPRIRKFLEMVTTHPLLTMCLVV